MSLPPEDAAYLIQEGLPEAPTTRFEVRFPEHDLQRVAGMPVIASDGMNMPICVDVAAGGKVVRWFRGDVHFVNSSVRAFGQYLRLFSEYAEQDDGRHGRWGDDKTEDPAFIALVGDIVQRMRAVDPPAMEEETCWGCTMEEVQNGVI